MDAPRSCRTPRAAKRFRALPQTGATPGGSWRAAMALGAAPVAGAGTALAERSSLASAGSGARRRPTYHRRPPLPPSPLPTGHPSRSGMDSAPPATTYAKTANISMYWREQQNRTASGELFVPSCVEYTAVDRTFLKRYPIVLLRSPIQPLMYSLYRAISGRRCVVGFRPRMIDIRRDVDPGESLV
jgi:hypothetical protein